MSSETKQILTCAIVGGACGMAGAALYLLWRSHRESHEDRARVLVRQMEQVARRLEGQLSPGTPQSDS